MRHRLPGALAALLLLPAVAAADAVIYDNGAPSASNGIEVTIRILAEDVVLDEAATVTGVRFWAIADLGAWSGTIDYFFFGSDGIVPTEVPFASGAAQDIEVVADGDRDRYTFALETPVELQAGTVYWLGLHMDDDFDENTNCCVFWSTLEEGVAVGSGAASARFGFVQNWRLTSNHHAFQLLPEPGGVASGGAGIVTLAALLARRNRRGRRRAASARGARGA